MTRHPAWQAYREGLRQQAIRGLKSALAVLDASDATGDMSAAATCAGEVERLLMKIVDVELLAEERNRTAQES